MVKEGSVLAGKRDPRGIQSGGTDYNDLDNYIFSLDTWVKLESNSRGEIIVKMCKKLVETRLFEKLFI